MKITGQAGIKVMYHNFFHDITRFSHENFLLWLYALFATLKIGNILFSWPIGRGLENRLEGPHMWAGRGLAAACTEHFCQLAQLAKVFKSALNMQILSRLLMSWFRTCEIATSKPNLSITL